MGCYRRFDFWSSFSLTVGFTPKCSNTLKSVWSLHNIAFSKTTAEFAILFLSKVRYFTTFYFVSEYSNLIPLLELNCIIYWEL